MLDRAGSQDPKFKRLSMISDAFDGLREDLKEDGNSFEQDFLAFVLSRIVNIELALLKLDPSLDFDTDWKKP